jgi:hypothetical protein
VRRQTGLPTVHMLCAPCLRDGARRKLATFDLGPDGPSVWAWNTAGGKVRPLWTEDPATGEDKVHLKGSPDMRLRSQPAAQTGMGHRLARRGPGGRVNHRPVMAAR